MKSRIFLSSLLISTASAFSLSMEGTLSRRAFFTKTATAAAVVGSATFAGVPKSIAAPEIFTTPAGVKYAVTKAPKDPKRAVGPAPGDIVAVDYTGYLVDGRIFDATHAEGKTNTLLFKLGSDAVIPGLNDVVSQMVVGQKVQAIIPPTLAFGDKGLCLDDGECLIKPGSTLVYDIYLKRSSIPPP